MARRRPARYALGARQLVLAIVALCGIWISVFIVRSHDPGVPVVESAPASVAAPQSVSSASTALGHTAQVVRAVVTPRRVDTPGLSVTAVAAAHTAAAQPARVAARPVATARPAAAEVEVSAAAAAPAPADANAPTDEEPSDSGRSVAETPPPPPEPLEIDDAQVVSVTPSTARVTWRTNLPAHSQAAYGLDAASVWAPASGGNLQHEALLTGLTFSTTYHVWLHALDDWGRAEAASLTVATPAMPAQVTAKTSGDDILVDDQPFFPLAVWDQCSDGFARNLADGINLFMGEGCEPDRVLPARLDGRAYSVVDAASADTPGRGVLGWYYQDEWDAFLQSNVTRNELRNAIVAPRAGRISFLTLTNHFYSRAEPLPQGKGMYPTLFSIPDVVGFDLYPLQVWCRPAFHDVFDAQHELHDLSGGKPTFQWIEAAKMEQPCAAQPALDPTPETVRAETWLAVAGGADAIGYFPSRWSDAVGDAIARVNREIESLAPALLAQTVPARSESDAIRVSARSLNGALYVIAVNTTSVSVQAKLSVDGIGGRSLTNLTDGGVVGADGDGFSDTLGPLAARVYVAPPQGW